jgi:alpha-beta hydrolase superfamily lysophospholipase
VVIAGPDRLGQAPGERWRRAARPASTREPSTSPPRCAAAPGPVHLFGHSYGGAVAMQMALRWPSGWRG